MVQHCSAWLMELLLLIKHQVENKNIWHCWRQTSPQHCCLFLGCFQCDLVFTHKSATIEEHVYGCISGLTVPALVFVGTNSVCQHEQDREISLYWGSGMHEFSFQLNRKLWLQPSSLNFFSLLFPAPTSRRPDIQFSFGCICFWLISYPWMGLMYFLLICCPLFMSFEVFCSSKKLCQLCMSS